MFALFGANVAAFHSVVCEFYEKRPSVTGLVVLLAVSSGLSGCAAPTTLSGQDPADPHAKVAAVGYRSTVAPYTSLRPTTPLSWRQQNDSVTPTPKSRH